MSSNPYAPPRAPVADAGRIDVDELDYAGFWIRFLAWIIDTVVVAVLTVPLLLWIYGSDYFLAESESFVQGPADALISYVLPAVWTLAFWLKAGATPGKMICGVRLVQAETAEPLTMKECVVRYLGYIPSTLVFCLGFLWVAWDERKQAWHDKLAGSVAIRI